MRIIASLSLLTIILSSCASSQTKVYLHVVSGVEYIITDPIGRKTGVDPRYSKPIEQWTRLEQIPNATYGSENTNEGGPSSLQFEAFLQSPQGDGTFTIELIGDTTAVSYLTVYVMPWVDSARVQRPYFEVEKIPVEKDSAITYLFTYHSAPASPVSLVKAVSARSLIQDVAAMFKLNWITSQSTADKYLDWFRVYGSQYQVNNFGAAQATLFLVLANLKADSARAMSADSYKSLRSDTEQLLSELPTVLASMDTLISVKHRSFDLGWLADANFVKELDNGLDNAKKHLAKGDSVNAYKEVEKFQENVNKEYEKTVDNQKKGKPRDKRFVTVESWKFLYYNAQYIMDRLPSGKKK